MLNSSHLTPFKRSETRQVANIGDVVVGIFGRVEIAVNDAKGHRFSSSNKAPDMDSWPSFLARNAALRWCTVRFILLNNFELVRLFSNFNRNEPMIHISFCNLPNHLVIYNVQHCNVLYLVQQGVLLVYDYRFTTLLGFVHLTFIYNTVINLHYPVYTLFVINYHILIAPK